MNSSPSAINTAITELKARYKKNPSMGYVWFPVPDRAFPSPSKKEYKNKGLHIHDEVTEVLDIASIVDKNNEDYGFPTYIAIARVPVEIGNNSKYVIDLISEYDPTAIVEEQYGDYPFEETPNGWSLPTSIGIHGVEDILNRLKNAGITIYDPEDSAIVL